MPGKASPATFFNKESEARTLVHGDDFVQLATQPEIDKMDLLLRSKYTVKLVSVIGPEERDDKEMCVLNRIIRFVDKTPEHPCRVEIEPDMRHAELSVRDLNLLDAKEVATPRAKLSSIEIRKGQNSPELENATFYRSCVMRASYLSQDRGDIGEATKCLAQHMKSPTMQDLSELKRLGRYLKKRLRACLEYEGQVLPE